MKIGVITFVSDPHLEDLIIATLINGDLPDYYLELRAINALELNEFCDRLDADEVQRLIITDAQADEFSFHKGLKVIRLDRMTDITKQIIQASVSGAVRNQVDETKPKLIKRFSGNLSVITGTSGSPGISTVAINLAYEIAREKKVRLVDADSGRNDLAFLLGGKRGADVVNLSPQLSISNELAVNSDTENIVDCGAASDLSTALSDRRLNGREFCNYIEAAKSVIFVFQPENNLMFELERFLDAHHRGIFSARPIFIINKVGSTQRQRSIQKRAIARIGNLPTITAPLDISTLERSKSQYSPIGEVAPRAKLRRSIRDLAELLIE